MTYLGFDILALDYNRTGPFEETSRRKFVLAGGIGKRWADEQSAAPAPGRPFTWTAFGRQEIWELLAFVDARKGRAVPFWMPSLQPDLSLSADFSPGASLATIRWIRYAQQMFGTTGARRHLALWTLGNPIFDCCRVVAASDPGDGITEGLTLDPPAARDYLVPVTVISFLKLCRLDADQVQVSYPTPGVAEAVIQVRELPMEAPL